jgi:ATP-dependent Lhr-like helicase
MKFIAERMGAMKRGLMVAADELNSIELRFAKTPIYEEGLREAMLLHTDYSAVREIFRQVRSGEIQIVTFKSIKEPTPLGYHILRRFVEAPELFSPEAEREANLDRMRSALNATPVNLLCFACGAFHESQRISSLDEKPVCAKCGSNLLGVLSWSAWSIRDALNKKMMKLDLSEDEQKALSRVRQTADLVAVYGRKAIIAQSVFGVGPQTASKILAKMHDDDKALYADLFEAKIRYITTRPYWDERPRFEPASRTLYT